MTYQEVHDLAHAIGFHRGRMRSQQNWQAIEIDKNAFDVLMRRVPKQWTNVAIRAHDAGITDGDTGPPAPGRRTRGRRA